MTDGRIPGKWMSDPKFIEMGVDAWCVFSKGIAWSNEAGTDGHIKRRYLGLLHPNGEQPQAYAEIADLGLWAPTPDGYQYLNWEKKAHQGGLGQSLASEVKAQKERKRKNQADYRERQKSAGGGDGGPGGGVTGDVTGDVSDHVGQDTTGQEQVQGSTQEDFKNFKPETGEVLDAPADAQVLPESSTKPSLSVVPNPYTDHADAFDEFVSQGQEELSPMAQSLADAFAFEEKHRRSS